MAAVPKSVDYEAGPPLSRASLGQLNAAVAGFDREQLLWSSGYLAGLAERSAQPVAGAAPAVRTDPAVSAPSEISWTVFYATETGNSRRLAEKLVAKAEGKGVRAVLQNIRDFRAKDLAKIHHAVFVVATHGIGEAPDGTEEFFEFWQSDRAPRLEHLNFSVLSLGDSSYADFCETGRLLDERLESLGAQRVSARVDCDLDFDRPAATWTDVIVAKALETARIGEPAAPAVDHRHVQLHAVGKPKTVSRDQPFDANLLLSQKITGRGSSKDVRHIELDIEGAGMHYQPGDSLAVIPTNPPQLVEHVLHAIGQEGSTAVTIDDETLPLADALLRRKEITALSRPLIDSVASRHIALQKSLADREQFSRFLKTRQLIDLVSDYPRAWDAQSFVDKLRSLTPRLYSIASSPDANPGEVHLTVAVVRHRAFGREHWGAASSLLASDVSNVPVYVEPNEHFRLPVDGNVPIIMIGAGTGVAPYRAFVEHRREHGHRGDNWLLFGERTFSDDFLYQLEWLRYRKEGILQRLDTAFSRDQKRKIYVQHRLIENSRVVYDWLQNGAHVYVCGDADAMAVDVHAALLEVVGMESGLSAEAAAEYLKELKSTGRYQRDVY